jgi:hypothetical protein
VPTHYETLGVPPTASPEEIRRAYRQQARQYHPDRHLQSSPTAAASAATRMAEVNHAWSVLSDPATKEHYDLELALVRAKAGRPYGATVGARPQGARPAGATGAATAPRPAAPRFHSDEVDVAPDAGVWSVIFRAVPWLVVIVVLGGIFVFTAFAASHGTGSTSSTAPVVPPTAAVGDCIRRVSSTELDLVDCESPNDGHIVEKVSMGKPCPSDARAIYLPDENAYACVRPY